PAVPLGELLDALDLTATAPTGAVRDAVVVRHPLQPFDARNATPGALVPGTPFTFDRAAVAGAVAAAGDRPPAPAFLLTPLPERTEDTVSVDDLVGFFCKRGGAVQGFLSRQRLDVALPRDEEP